MILFNLEQLNKFRYSEKEKLIEAGDRPTEYIEKVDYKEIELITLFKPKTIELGEFEWRWSFDRYVPLNEIQEALGCSNVRFNRALQRLNGNSFKFNNSNKTRRIKRENRAYNSLKTIDYNNQTWLKVNYKWDEFVELKLIVADIAVRRPALPKAKAWAKRFGITLDIK